MGIQIELATLFSEPASRRCWLLNKALENAPLDEALRLARAADEFLGIDEANAQALPNGQPLKEWRLRSSSTAPNQDSQSADRPPIATSPCDQVEQHAGHTSTADHVADTPDNLKAADNLKNAGAVENDRLEDASNKSEVEEAGDEPGDSEPQVAMTSSLAVLAGMDDLVRYLRQQDDVVVSAGLGTYLVNGRFHLNSEELLARANKIRQRQGKLQFQRIPSGFPAPKGGEAAGRKQDRT